MHNLSQQQITTFIFLLLATLLVLTSPAHSAGSRYCKIDHYHSGSGSLAATQSRAKASAARSWSSFTSWEYGNQWGKISLAMDKRYNCTHPTDGWKCTVVAKPCKITGRAAKVKTYHKSVRKAKRSRRLYRRKLRRRTAYRTTRKRSHYVKSRRVRAKKWTMKW